MIPTTKSVSKSLDNLGNRLGFSKVIRYTPDGPQEIPMSPADSSTTKVKVARLMWRMQARKSQLVEYS